MASIASHLIKKEDSQRGPVDEQWCNHGLENSCWIWVVREDDGSDTVATGSPQLWHQHRWQITQYQHSFGIDVTYGQQTISHHSFHVFLLQKKKCSKFLQVSNPNKQRTTKQASSLDRERASHHVPWFWLQCVWSECRMLHSRGKKTQRATQSGWLGPRHLHGGNEWAVRCNSPPIGCIMISSPRKMIGTNNRCVPAKQKEGR